MEEVLGELKIRERISSIYNKTREDFDSKDTWDNYLEDVEDISGSCPGFMYAVYNLSNNIDKQATEARVKDYERANRASIIANQAKKANAERAAMGVLPSQAEAAAASAALAAENNQAFAPTANIAGALPRQPMPVKSVQLDQHGSLLRPATAPRLPMGSPEEQAISAAAGWSPELPRIRALQEAFGSLLLTTGR